MTRKTVLIADDEKDIVELIAYNLEGEGFAVLKAHDGRTAWERVRKAKPDLVLLDLMMPGMPGMDVCRAIRGHAETAAVPVIMLTAKTEPLDKILGLELGADDYITKPFHVRELIARIRAVLRRAGARAEDVPPGTLEVGGLRIDFGTYRVTVDGRRVDLSSLEFKLLGVLASRPGRVFSREQLLDRVWGRDIYVDTRTVDVHVGRLRKALSVTGGDDPLRTVRGAGYSLG